MIASNDTAERRRPRGDDAPRRIAYLSLQSVEQGQDTWAAVNEIVEGWRGAGWQVDTWFVSYPSATPSAAERIREMRRIQVRLQTRLGDYDAVYIRAHVMAYPTSVAAREVGMPVFQECNGTYEDLFVAWPVTRLARPLFEGRMRRQFRDATFIFCGTEQQKVWLQRETGHDRIEVSPNGANSELFRPDTPKRPGLPESYVLFFGQFAPWQGIEVLIAARQFGTWPSGVKLLFVGDGARRPAVEAAVASSRGEVVYVGRLPYEELPGVIAHCLASTSPQFTHERGVQGFSALKVYESMSCGVPVIGSDYPGVGDVIRHYECGVVVPPGDAEALANAVARIVAHPDDAREMGLRGRRAVELECSWRARAAQRQAAMEAAILRAQDRGGS